MNSLLPRAVLACLMFSPLLGLAADKDSTPKVHVPSILNPVDKSYRKMVEGMNIFERNQHLAPQASLRFRLMRRKTDVDMNGIVLKVIGDSMAIHVPLAADNSFVLERNQLALDQDAAVIPDRKADSMTWRAMVRSPGLPENTRRMGDLRLECLVGMSAGLVSKYSVVTNGLRRLSGTHGLGCNLSSMNYLLFAERPLFSVTLRDGNRSEVLPFFMLYAGGAQFSAQTLAMCDCQVMQDRTYRVPMSDRSWSDNTLIQFDYMDDTSTQQAAAVAVPTHFMTVVGTAQERTLEAGKSGKDDVLVAMGEPHKVAFETGYEVWLYQYDVKQPEGVEKKEVEALEFVVLFGPDGKVKKMRSR